MSTQQTIRVLAAMEAFTVTGPAKNLIRFAQAARGRESVKVTLEVVTYVRPGYEKNPFLDALSAADVPVHVIQERRAMDARAMAAFGDVLERANPDVLQTHNVKSHLFARMLSGGRPPWIAFCHGYTTPTLKQRVYDLADYVSLRAADRVVVVCRAFSPVMHSRGVEECRLRVLHNSIEVRSVSAAPDAGGGVRRAAGTLSIVSIGRLSSEKGHDTLIRAVAALRSQSLPVTAVLVGDGPERARLEAQAKQLGVGKDVVFVGHQGNVGRFLKSADVFVLPSRSEGSPNALLEAMAAGVPVVSTSVGGVPEIVVDRIHALLVPPDAPAALASAVKEVFEQPVAAAERARAAASRVQQDFSPGAYVERLCGFYRELLAGARASSASPLGVPGAPLEP